MDELIVGEQNGCTHAGGNDGTGYREGAKALAGGGEVRRLLDLFLGQVHADCDQNDVIENDNAKVNTVE